MTETYIALLKTLKELHAENGLFVEALDKAIELVTKDAEISESRNLAIYYGHKYGRAISDLAKQYGISKQRVSAICKKYECREGRKEFQEFTTRTENVLLRAGITTVQQLADFYKENGEEGLYRIRNCGGTTLAEIICFLERNNLIEKEG